jgi:hypothetical protein
MPAVHLQNGVLLRVERVDDIVTLHDGSRFERGQALQLAHARELCAVLNVGMHNGGPPLGIIGQVPVVGGRTLFVKRSAGAMSFTNDPQEHPRWNARLLDQAEALRDAIDEAAGHATA